VKPADRARKIAKKLAAIEGVVGVTLGGSHARGTADKESDLDLGVYYRAEAKPHLDRLRELAASLDDRGKPDACTDFGAWGPWMNGGAWLRIDGKKVDWIYREIGHLAETIREAREGRISVDYQAGFPWGFASHAYMGEVALGVVLADPSGILAGLKKLAAQYPEGLKRGVTTRFLWEAEFSLENASAVARRKDLFPLAGWVFRVSACLLQVLFAVNGVYWTNEKGALGLAAHFKRAPKRLVPRLESALAKPSAASLKTLAKLLEETRALAAS